MVMKAKRTYREYVADKIREMDEPQASTVVMAMKVAPKPSEVKKVTKPITLKLRPFIMKDMGLDSRIITGEVKRETAKAWLIEGQADMLENISFCVRCGRELTEPASQVTGMGRICAEKFGVNYDSNQVLNASRKEREKIRAHFKRTLNGQKFERWIPKSQAEVFING